MSSHPASREAPGAPAALPPVRLAYVAGSGHSGSTLLALLLDAHPRIVAVGEMHAPRHPEDRPGDRMCSCGRTMASCPFWAEVGRRMAARGVPFDPTGWDLRLRLHPARPLDRFLTGTSLLAPLERLRDGAVALHPGARRARQALERANEAFCRACLEAAGKEIVLDATKEPGRISFLARSGRFDLRVLHLVRDPRGYAWSRMRDAGLPAARAAADWARTNAKVEAALARRPGLPHMTVRYEDLCADPSGTVLRVARFLDAGNGPPAPSPGPAHVMGNKMRLAARGAPEVRLDERWRREMPEADRRAVERLTGEAARRLGYAP